MDYLVKLQQLLASQQRSLQCYALEDGSSVWVRKVNEGNPFWRYQALNFIAKRIFRLPVLQAVYSNPSLAIQDEARRLQELYQAGVKVPKLLALNENGLMLEDLGDFVSFAHILDQYRDMPTELLSFWQNLVSELFAVHDKDQYLSQAFIRNFLYSEEGNTYCIDFEEDPKLFLSLEQCQIRDYLFFLHSSAFYMVDNLAPAVDFFALAISKRPQVIQEELLSTIKALKWISKLTPIKHCGRDGYRTYCASIFINSLYEKLN